MTLRQMTICSAAVLTLTKRGNQARKKCQAADLMSCFTAINAPFTMHTEGRETNRVTGMSCRGTSASTTTLVSLDLVDIIRSCLRFLQSKDHRNAALE